MLWKILRLSTLTVTVRSFVQQATTVIKAASCIDNAINAKKNINISRFSKFVQIFSAFQRHYYILSRIYVALVLTTVFTPATDPVFFHHYLLFKNEDKSSMGCLSDTS